jgi:hypothetical protein
LLEGVARPALALLDHPRGPLIADHLSEIEAFFRRSINAA